MSKKNLAKCLISYQRIFQGENGSQYTNYKMSEIYLKPNLPKHKLQYIPGLVVLYNSLNTTKAYVSAIIWHDKWTDMQNN